MSNEIYVLHIVREVGESENKFISDELKIGLSVRFNPFYYYPEEILHTFLFSDIRDRILFRTIGYKKYQILSSDGLADGWDCDKSPNKKCAYNILVDTALDHCIYCGNPYERK